MTVRATSAAGACTGTERFVDDGLDGARATAAFGAAAEATIDLLGVTNGVVGISEGGADVVVAEDVTGTNNHGKRRSPSVMRHHRYLRGPSDAKGKTGI